MVFFALYRKKVINRFQHQLYKLVKHTRQQQFVGKLPANYFSVFDHFVGLGLKGLTFV